MERTLAKRGISLKVFRQLILHVQQHLDPRYFSAFKNTTILKTEMPLGTRLCSNGGTRSSRSSEYPWKYCWDVERHFILSS